MCTITRLAEAHLCPALLNADNIVHFIAFSMSASYDNNRVFTLRNSFNDSDDFLAMYFPTNVEPVKLIILTRLLSTSASPVVVHYHGSYLVLHQEFLLFCYLRIVVVSGIFLILNDTVSEINAGILSIQYWQLVCLQALLMLQHL